MYIVQSYAKEHGYFAVTKNCSCLMDSIVGSHHQLCHVYVATNNNTYITSLEPRYTQIRAQTISSTLHQSWVIVRSYSKNASILENYICFTSFFTVLTSQQATRKIINIFVNWIISQSCPKPCIAPSENDMADC